MKKIFLLIGLSILTMSLWAEGQPSVIIHKSNGGEWAWLNLYNDILYTPSLEPGAPAHLDCTGRGFSLCRVPRDNSLQANATSPAARQTEMTEADQVALADAINAIIEASENALQNGRTSGTLSRTIVTPTQVRGINKTFCVRGTWSQTERNGGECTIYIYITEASSLRPR